jgi:hypothetical protein
MISGEEDGASTMRNKSGRGRPREKTVGIDPEIGIG